MRDTQLKKAALVSLLSAKAARADADSVRQAEGRVRDIGEHTHPEIYRQIEQLVAASEGGMRKDFQSALGELLSLAGNMAHKGHGHSEFSELQELIAGLAVKLEAKAAKGHRHADLVGRGEFKALADQLLLPSIEGDFLVIRDAQGELKSQYLLKRQGGGGSTQIIQQAAPPQDAEHLLIEAGEAIAKGDALITGEDGRLYRASNLIFSHAQLVFGVAGSGGAAGTQIKAVIGGRIEHPGWTFQPRAPVYVGTNGALASSPGIGAFSLQMGHAHTATSLIVRPHIPIVT